MDEIADKDQREKIDEFLSKYPILESIITKDEKFYRLTRSQFGDTTPKQQQELRLSGILLSQDPEFLILVHDIEIYLSRYSEYVTKKFGDALVDDFLSRYSELEFYHFLKEAKPKTIIRNPLITKDSGKNLDFLIQWGSAKFFIEVTTPLPSQEYENMFDEGGSGFADPAKGIGPKNQGDYSRATYIIQKEIEKHFNGISADEIPHPVVLAINVHWTAGEIAVKRQELPWSELPDFVTGILLYSVNPISSHFYKSPTSSWSGKQRHFFVNLV